MISSFFTALGSLASDHVSLLMMLVKATIILIAALGITLSMQRASAGSRHLVWLVTLGMLLLVPALSTWAPLPIRILPAATTTPDVATAATFGAPRAERNATLRSAEGNTINVSTRSVPVAEQTSPSVLERLNGMSSVTLLLSIWAVVVAGIVLMLTWAGFSVRRIVRRARPLESPDWLTPLFEIADRLGLEESPRLLQSADAKMPFACGVLKPTIVLPSESESWSLDRRRAVLLHELAHVRRHDLLGHTLGRLVCAVYWFHPLVWTAAKRLRSESERACDDLALACGTRATDYAEHLLDIVTSVRGDTTPLVALAMARRKEFEGRMLAILDPDLRHSTPSRKQSIALIATLALISLTVGAASPVARRADAAVVATNHERPAPAPVVSPAPVAELRDAPVAAPLQGKAYPDSGVPGVMWKSISKSVSKSVSQSVTQSVSPSVSQTTSQGLASSSRAIQAIAEAGINISLNAAAKGLQEYASKGSKGDKGAKNPDDRPILLAKVLRSDSSASLRRIAAWGLQEYADTPIAVEALSNAVRHDSDAKVREMAAWALAQGDDRAGGAVDALHAALKSDASERVRVTAAWALGNIGDRTSVDALSAALSDASPEVRTRAAWALGNVQPKSAPKQLVAMLSDPESRVRELAAWALYNIEDPSTAPALEAALKTEQNKNLQISYIRALAAMGDKSVDAIRGLLESPDQRIKTMAVRALAGGHATGPWPMPWPEPRPFP
jgi:beta-lactamase regulating signal transducer with metallopeptidase domain